MHKCFIFNDIFVIIYLSHWLAIKFNKNWDPDLKHSLNRGLLNCRSSSKISQHLGVFGSGSFISIPSLHLHESCSKMYVMYYKLVGPHALTCSHLFVSPYVLLLKSTDAWMWANVCSMESLVIVWDEKS